MRYFLWYRLFSGTVCYSFLCKLKILWFCMSPCLNHRCKHDCAVQLKMSKMLWFWMASNLFFSRFFQFSPSLSDKVNL